MHKRSIVGISAFLLLLALAWMPETAASQDRDFPGAGGDKGTSGFAGDVKPFDSTSGSISFISSPLPTCSQPDPAINACYINWDSLYVSSAPAPYMISMTITINNRIRAAYHGFFQNAFSLDNTMHGRGFKVACGMFGAGGDPLMGLRHTYIILAEDSNGLKATNSGSLHCPGVRLGYLPLLAKR